MRRRYEMLRGPPVTVPSQWPTGVDPGTPTTEMASEAGWTAGSSRAPTHSWTLSDATSPGTSNSVIDHPCLAWPGVDGPPSPRARALTRPRKCGLGRGQPQPRTSVATHDRSQALESGIPLWHLGPSGGGTDHRNDRGLDARSARSVWPLSWSSACWPSPRSGSASCRARPHRRCSTMRRRQRASITSTVATSSSMSAVASRSSTAMMMGSPDLYFAGGTNEAALYRNQSPVGGELRFARQADAVTDLVDVTGAYPLDVDGDGRPDLAVLRRVENVLLRGTGRLPVRTRQRGTGGSREARPGPRRSAPHGRARPTLPTLAFGNYLDESAGDAGDQPMLR